METIVLGASTYRPTSPRTGLSGKTILRMGNMILTGANENVYLQCYKGSRDLGEMIPTLPLTGTLSAGVGDTTITGLGTAFTTELQTGQWFWAGDSPLMVNRVIDNTTLTVYLGPLTTLTNASGTRLPVLFDLVTQRATLSARGNAIESDSGTIFATGVGTLLIEGQPLQGSSMVLTGSPRVAIFDPLTGNYAIYSVGFAAPSPAPALTDIAGGAQGMVAGDYSVRLTGASSITEGQGNPGVRANVSLGTDGDQIQVDISGVTFDTAAGVDQANAYATQLNIVNVNQGPWNLVRKWPLASGNIFTLDYLNAEVARQGELEFDNDPPPDAGFVATLQSYLQWVSCYGKFGGPPGPVLVPAKPNNIEAAPAEWTVTSSPPEVILDVVTSQARLYLPCPTSLQQGVYAPTGDPLVPPTQIRAFWDLGFASFQQLVFAQDLLVGYPRGGPTRSTADVETVKTQFLGAHVAEIIQRWEGAYVKCGWDADPMVNAICFFQPAIRQNSGGWWETDVLIWGINQEDWIGQVTITDLDRDMVVCSVAAVNNQLTFLAGGRIDNIGTIQIDTFAWNSISGDEVAYYVAWQLQAGSLDRNNTIRSLRANGKFTEGLMQLYGFDSSTPENLSDIEDGINAQGEVVLGTTTDVETTSRERLNFPSNFVFTARISGTYNGSDEIVDRVNGCVIEFMPQGNRR